MNRSRVTKVRAPRSLPPLQWLVAGSLLLVLAAAAIASPGRSPTALVKETTEQLFSALARAPQNPERAFLDTVSPQMDLEKASQWALGKHWRTMSPSQREQFVVAFRDMIANAYGAAIAEHTDAKVEYLAQGSGAKEGQAMVRTRVMRAVGAPLHIDYRLVESAAGWKLFDIRVEGVSLITSYRPAFDAKIAQHGVDGLLRALAEKRSGA